MSEASGGRCQLQERFEDVGSGCTKKLGRLQCTGLWSVVVLLNYFHLEVTISLGKPPDTVWCADLFKFSSFAPSLRSWRRSAVFFCCYFFQQTKKRAVPTPPANLTPPWTGTPEDGCGTQGHLMSLMQGVASGGKRHEKTDKVLN